MVRNSLAWGEAGHVPAYTPVAESEEYQELSPQTDYAAAGETPVLDPEAAVELLGSSLTSWASRSNPAEGDA